MFLIIPFLFLGILLPIFCIGLLTQRDADPTIKALAIVLLSPYVFVIVRILRINL